jgi:arylsulfatase
MNKQPNILFFFPDQFRFDWLGCHGTIPVRTPNIDSLAVRGVRFTNAICPSPLCSPSRAALAQGVEYDQCQVPDNDHNYPEGITSFYRALQNAGYHTMGCGKFDLGKPRYSWGRQGKQEKAEGGSWFDDWGFSDGIDNAGKWDGVREALKGNLCPYHVFLEEEGLLQVYADDMDSRKKAHFTNTEPSKLPDYAYGDNWIGENGRKLIKSCSGDKPWFLQVNFNGPHDPMDVTRSMAESCDSVSYPFPYDHKELSPEKNNEIRRNYSSMVENIDRQIGLFLDLLKERGELDNTIIVLSSDHGEMLGDHDRWAKSVPWQPSVSIPLIVCGPGIAQGMVNNEVTANLDLSATFVDLGGAEKPDTMTARSLMPVLEGKKSSVRERVFSGLGSWHMVYDGTWKFISQFEGENYLFNLENDRDEIRNLANNPDYKERVESMRNLLYQP